MKRVLLDYLKDILDAINLTVKFYARRFSAG